MEVPKKEILQDELNLSFFIQFVRIEGGYDTYYKLYATVKTEDGGKIEYQHLSPEEMEFNKILEQIKKLYQVYRYTNNEKLVEGAREEILKLTALIIWNIYH